MKIDKFHQGGYRPDYNGEIIEFGNDGFDYQNKKWGIVYNYSIWLKVDMKFESDGVEIDIDDAIKLANEKLCEYGIKDIENTKIIYCFYNGDIIYHWPNNDKLNNISYSEWAIKRIIE